MADGAGVLDVNVPNFITVALMVALLGALFGGAVVALRKIKAGKSGGPARGARPAATSGALSADGLTPTY